MTYYTVNMTDRKLLESILYETARTVHWLDRIESFFFPIMIMLAIIIGLQIFTLIQLQESTKTKLCAEEAEK